MQITCSSVAYANSIKSSAKNKCDMWTPPLDALRGFHTASSTLSCIHWLSRSRHNRKMYGDNGSPCRSPMVGLIVSVNSPFHGNLQWLLLITLIITIISTLGSPTSLSVSSTNPHSSQPYAFSMSSFRIIPPLLNFVKCIV